MVKRNWVLGLLAISAQEAPLAAPAFAGWRPSGTSFLASLAMAVSVTLVSELGDRTFFATAILSGKYSKIPVLLGAVAALWLQTLGCAAVGAAIQSGIFSPGRFTDRWWIADIPWRYVLSGTVLLCVGAHCLREQPDDDDGDVLNYDLPDYEDPLENAVRKIQLLNSQDDILLSDAVYTQPETPRDIVPLPLTATSLTHLEELRAKARARTDMSEALLSKARTSICSSKAFRQATSLLKTRRDNSGTVFRYTLKTIFAAELGDGSMFSTIALSSAQNPWGVAAGACFAHFLTCCCAVAMSGILMRYISERTLSIIGGIMFLALGFLAFAQGLNEIL